MTQFYKEKERNNYLSKTRFSQCYKRSCGNQIHYSYHHFFENRNERDKFE